MTWKTRFAFKPGLLWFPISMWWCSPQHMATCPLSASTSLLHGEMPGHEHRDPSILTCRLKAVWTVNSGFLVIPNMVQGRRLQVGLSLRPHASQHCSQRKMSTGGTQIKVHFCEMWTLLKDNFGSRTPMGLVTISWELYYSLWLSSPALLPSLLHQGSGVYHGLNALSHPLGCLPFILYRYSPQVCYISNPILVSISWRTWTKPIVIMNPHFWIFWDGLNFKYFVTLSFLKIHP